MITTTDKRIKATTNMLETLIVCENYLVDNFLKIETDYKGNARPPMPKESWTNLHSGDFIGGNDAHFWIYKRLKTPKQTRENTKLYFELKTGREGQWDAVNPQCLVFLDGKEVQGMDVNHTDVELEFGKEYDLHIYMYTGIYDIDTGLGGGNFCFISKFIEIDLPTRDLYYDMIVPFEGLACLNDNDDNRAIITKHLDMACNLLDLREPYNEDYYRTVAQATNYLETEFYSKACGKSDTEISCIGHTHIDVAWKWRLCQTEEKAQRSFVTVLKLMEEFDDYIFMSSQPQLYKYVKENAPQVYERIKARIKEGRWEPEGSMWLEPDCNLSSGESLIRQILHGKKFMKEEFGVDNKILWLPDVFGYSSALPQILKKSGIDYFVTSKISWNDTNKIPYDAFMWEGIDGTEIFTTFMTAQPYTYDKVENYSLYVGDITPGYVMGARKRFQQKEFTNRAMISFGYGDGGGGSTRKMMEYHRRLKYGLPGFPKTVVETTASYLEKLKRDFTKSAEDLHRTPKWVGELYLEFHRGTYTSVAKIKKNNRTAEILFQKAEQMAILSSIFCGTAYPKQEIYKAWETILLNQFHDILPGSSIKEVYEDSDIQYAQINAIGNKIIAETENALAQKLSTDVVYNPNSFVANAVVDIDGQTMFVENIPAMGWAPLVIKTENSISVTKEKIETPFYTILLDKKANITSIYDKENGREVVIPGKSANKIEAFEDMPLVYDNWELPAYYKQKQWDVDDVTEVTPIYDGVRSGLCIRRKFMHSEIVQNMYVYEHIRRIDFETTVDWKESHIVLKAAFPINIHTDKAIYETQFGYIERPAHGNTSYDWAKFEVCGHKYADVSEDDYGAAILNDCKYGYNAEGSTLKLTMLKCGTNPYQEADKEIHKYTYSLLPHKGKHTTAGVIQEGYLLNNPVKVIKANGDGTLPEKFTIVSCDKENVIVETVKQAEDKKGYVIRGYEAYNRLTEAKLVFGFNVKKAYLCDMLENVIEELEVKGNAITISMHAFEIVTVKVEV